MFDMIHKVRSEVQETRQRFRDDLPISLKRAFSRELSSDEWTAMFKALGKTDWAALTNSMGVRCALEMISSSHSLDAEIRRLEGSIAVVEPRRFAKMQAKSRQLAHFMMTGEHGAQLLCNAEAIARMLGEKNFLLTSPPAHLVNDIDRLVTVYAIDLLDQRSRVTMANLIETQRDGVEFIISYLVGNRIDELAKIGTNQVARLNHYKGHIPSEALQGGSLTIASATEHAHLLSRGYKKVSDYEGSSADRMLGSRAYYFAPISGLAPFSQGALQTVHQTVSGIDPETGYSVGEIMGGRISEMNQVRLIERQIGSQRQTSENLRPIFDDNGKVTAYERTADVSKLTSLHRSTDLAQMIGVWRCRQMEELLAVKVNGELVDRLYEIWERDRKLGKQNEFVNIARLRDKDKDDSILVDAAKIIPPQTRDYIKWVFGRDDFWVRRDMVLDTFGKRQASIRDRFTDANFESLAVGILGNKAFPILVRSEKSIQDLSANVKNPIKWLLRGRRT
ncbi:hypothetical protein [Aurantimonas sp. A3-2-R12]|uniref:hypothetical protein n=1 Tax=Aurantimonas sp. A3-2-R12 TaxID=3114362 RepID=UPI002E1941D9|nr:hypothetical protein [Aurantimonas sp. A3-2-R12]